MLFDILVYYLESKIDCLQNISLSKEWTDFLENELNREWVSGYY
jgi:hypothetical protein